MAAEVFLIRRCEHLRHRVRYAAHAERQHRAVRDLLDHQLGDGNICLAWLAVAAKRQRLMLALDDKIGLGKMYAVRAVHTL